jgi:hypothetical protein
MSKVYVTTYEIIGSGLAKAAQYYADADAAQAKHWEHVEAVGGEGMRPDHNGGLRSVFFKELPAGWREIARQSGKMEAVPRRGTKAGKAAQEALDALPRIPRPCALASALGYNPAEMALDGERGVIYFPTELRVSFPAQRFFIRLPRFEKDGFTPDDAELKAVPESELMKAVEDHNAEAARSRQKEAA